MDNQLLSSMVLDIRNIIETARRNVAQEVNNELIAAYWKIGEIIVRYEQNDNIRAAYGKQTLKQLSKTLTAEFGKGFSISNIQFMRRFYQEYKIQQTLSVKLTWSHYCELLAISDKNKREFYEQEVLNLALNGIEINQPKDIIKDPYVFEFLGVPENKPMLEGDLEKALVRQIEKFLLELGRGFMFVGTQQRITINNTHYYADMVFYNKPLKSYVIIELKTTKLMPEAVGQLNMYLNYYENEVNDEGDNKPIGIILCTDKDAIAAEYALGGLSTNIFASKYTYYIPEKEQLIAEVERIVSQWHEQE